MAQPLLETIGGWQRKVSNVPPSFPLEPKDEPTDIDESFPLFQDYQISYPELMKDERLIKEEEMDNDNSFSIEHKEEPIDIHGHLSQYYQTSALEFMRDEKMLKEEEMDDKNMEGITANSNFMYPDSWTGAQYSGSDYRYGNSLNDHNYARAVKRRSSGDDESVTASKKLRGTKTNESVLECPECDFRTRSVRGLVSHLRNMHYTTLTLAGLALLCECGNESFSDAHNRKCDRNITVILKRDPTWRRGDEKTTPQCVLCKVYPRNARCYAVHLHVRHKTTLAENGIYLICSCGVEVRSITGGTKQLGECNTHQFTLHRMNEE